MRTNTLPRDQYLTHINDCHMFDLLIDTDNNYA